MLEKMQIARIGNASQYLRNEGNSPKWRTGFCRVKSSAQSATIFDK